MKHNPRKVGHRNRADKPSQRTNNAQHFAVLFTRRTTESSVSLVSSGTTEQVVTYAFSPLQPLGEQGEVLGILEPQGNLTQLNLCEMSVLRGRKTSSKHPEPLYVLQRFAQRYYGWPAPRQRGFIKSVYNTAQSLKAIEHGGLRYWVALALELDGWLESAQLKQAARQFGLTPPHAPATIIRQGPLWINPAYITRQAAELTRLLSRPHANPLRDRLTPEQTGELLGLNQPVVAGEVLRQLAADHGLRRRKLADGSYIVPLPAGKFRPVPTDSQQRVCAEIMQRYAAGEGVPRNELGRLYPSQRDVVAWVFEAGLLIDSGSGYVFTRVQLEEWQAKLAKAGISEADASIRQLKDELGLARRDAEALRELYQQGMPPRQDSEAEL